MVKPVLPKCGRAEALLALTFTKNSGDSAVTSSMTAVEPRLDLSLTTALDTVVGTVIDTLIVGSGVIGLSLAWELSQRGQAVAVVAGPPIQSQMNSSQSHSDGQIDRSTRSGEAATSACTSWTAAGILPPANFDLATDPLDRFRGFSHQIWPDWAARIQKISGVDVGLIACGGYYLAETAGEAAAMTGMTAYWDELNIDCQAISREQLRLRLPRLSTWIDSNPWMHHHPDRAAWWVPDEFQVRPPRLLQALRKACVEGGVRFIDDTTVTALEDSPSSITAYASREQDAACGVATANRVVLCGGAATGLMDSTMGLQNSLIPIRGQILLLKCDAFQDPAVINIGNRYLVSRGDGNVLVGSCEEEAGFAQQPTALMIEQLRHFAARLSPELADAPEIARWAGLRPMTFDGFPMLGHVPGRPSVYIAAGHYRSGIHFSPATAVAMADMIEGKPSFMDFSPFAVSVSPGDPSGRGKQ